MGEFFLGKVW